MSPRKFALKLAVTVLALAILPAAALAAQKTFKTQVYYSCSKQEVCQQIWADKSHKKITWVEVQATCAGPETYAVIATTRAMKLKKLKRKRKVVKNKFTFKGTAYLTTSNDSASGDNVIGRAALTGTLTKGKSVKLKWKRSGKVASKCSKMKKSGSITVKFHGTETFRR